MIEANGIKFLADPRGQGYVDGLEVDLVDYYGRQSLVAINKAYGGCW